MRLMREGALPTSGILVRNDRLDVGFQTIGELICAAYDVQPFQVAGPDWLISELKSPSSVWDTHVFDVHARLLEGTGRKQVPAMLERLLKDRFGMLTHREQRQFPVYALTIAEGGAHLRPGTPESESFPEGTPATGLDNGEEQHFQQVQHGSVVWAEGFGRMQQTFTPEGLHIEASDLTMDRLAQMITPYFERPVINATGLEGGYRVVLDIGHDEWRAVMGAAGAPCRGSGCNPASGANPTGKSLRESIRKSGLRLVPEKHLLEVIVVDRVEREPTDN